MEEVSGKGSFSLRFSICSFVCFWLLIRQSISALKFELWVFEAKAQLCRLNQLCSIYRKGSHFFSLLYSNSNNCVVIAFLVWALARMVTSAVKSGGDAQSILRLEAGDTKGKPAAGPNGALRRPRRR